MKTKLITLLIVLSSISVKAYSQFTWYNPVDDKKQITAEWFKPLIDENLDQNDKVTFFSSVLFLKGFLPVSENIHFLFDLPFSYWGFKDGDGVDEQASHTTIGNIYLGGQFKLSEIFGGLSPSIETGFRLPTMPEPGFPDKRGYFTGYYSSIDRREAFTDNIIPAMGFLHLDYKINPVATIRLSGGASYWVTTKNSPTSNQLYLTQSFQVNFTTPELGGRIGLTGKYNVAPTDSYLSRDDITQFHAGVNKSFKKWKLEVFIRTPLENQFFELAYGSKLLYQL